MPPEAFAPADALAIPYARILIVFVLTALTSGALALWLRRLRPGSGCGPRRLLKVLDTIPLGPRRAVHAIDAAGRILLVATTADRVELLTEFPSEPALTPDSTTAPVGDAVQAPGESPPDPDGGGGVRVLPPIQAEPAFAQVLTAARKFNMNKSYA